MGTSVFPTLPGLAWPVDPQPEFATLIRQAVGGQETRVAQRPFPRRHWKLDFEVLRQGAVNGTTTYTELVTLYAFFMARMGKWDSFLFADTFTPDFQVTAQSIGNGTGAQTAFQLVRSFGGIVEPIVAPNLTATLNVYLAGALQAANSYSVSPWGSGTPGMITFNVAPGNTVAVTVDFSFYFPVRFDIDQCPFSVFMSQLSEAKGIELVSVLN